MNIGRSKRHESITRTYAKSLRFLESEVYKSPNLFETQAAKIKSSY